MSTSNDPAGGAGAICGFTDRLPVEIRIKIYRLLLKTEEPIVAGTVPQVELGGGTRPKPAVELAVLQLNLQIREEATRVFYGQNQFRFSVGRWKYLTDREPRFYWKVFSTTDAVDQKHLRQITRCTLRVCTYRGDIRTKLDFDPFPGQPLEPRQVPLRPLAGNLALASCIDKMKREFGTKECHNLQEVLIDWRHSQHSVPGDWEEDPDTGLQQPVFGMIFQPTDQFVLAAFAQFSEIPSVAVEGPATALYKDLLVRSLRRKRGPHELEAEDDTSHTPAPKPRKRRKLQRNYYKYTK
ncbi:MAG: hypothetical protein M4579_004061 [Chaenotheca gracillima]|nr:MAG: hypothetical protein M4579_004061 [Chaenotheca gracillima]